jgi:sigma-B regulation protein RsbU (phosphoserine phosphatase)
LNREIEIAREVQERLFPQELPEFSGIDYAGSCRPALGVGGDYYDFIRLSDTELGIAIGDVSGKGIPAALLMASLRASLRGQTIRREDDLATLMSNVNKLVYESSTSNRYATFFYAQYDSVSRKLTYVNAGHNPPLLLRANGTVEWLSEGGLPLGVMEDAKYEERPVALATGDVLVLYTDGVTEASNDIEDQYGVERLEALVRKNATRPAVEIVEALRDEVVTFTGARHLNDDLVFAK